MISPMTTARPQQRYDHRLRELVHRTGDLTIATDLGVPPSTARGWLGTAPTVVVSLEVADLTELQLRREVLTLRRREGAFSRRKEAVPARRGSAQRTVTLDRRVQKTFSVASKLLV